MAEGMKSLRPSPETVRDWSKWLVTSAISIAAALITTYKWVDKHATEEEVVAMIRQHDADQVAHKALLDSLANQAALAFEHGKQLAQAQEQAKRDREALFWAYWVLVGDKASELEQDPRKRRRTAEETRDRFEAYYRQGFALADAFRRALKTPVP